MSDHPNPLWLRWLGHTLHGEALPELPHRRARRMRFDDHAAVIQGDDVAAAVRDSGLPNGFPFPWM